jgi:hypothetical protein
MLLYVFFIWKYVILHNMVEIRNYWYLIASKIKVLVLQHWAKILSSGSDTAKMWKVLVLKYFTPSTDACLTRLLHDMSK